MDYRIIIMVGIMLFLCSCASETPAEPSKTFTLSQPGDMVSYEVEQKDGYTMDTYIIESESTNTDSFSEWQAWNAKREADAKYRMYQMLRESEDADTFAQTEEDRIETYCEEYGYAACKGISVTCEKAGCHIVTVACDDDNFDSKVDEDDECHRFAVSVDEEIDPRLTEQADKQIISDGYHD
jgi:hypothetical protein